MNEQEAKEYLANNSSPEALTGCWLWQKRLNRKGYAMLGSERFIKSTFAHRLSFAAYHGKLGEGLEVDHRCRNRSCVNPDHLRAVTHTENMRNGAHALKTHCKNGHPFSGDNCVRYKGRVRDCRACADARRAAFRRRRREGRRL